MLSLAVIKGASSKKMAQYYTAEYAGDVDQDNTVEIENAAERTRWWGPGAAERGLDGPVEHDDLQAVLEGRDPRTGQLLYDPSAAQLGNLQKTLGIERSLGASDIAALRKGLNPETGQKLPLVAGRMVENWFSGRKGMDRSVSAVDMTLSAPKSVSLMVAVGGEEIRRAAAEAHELAVERALKFVADELVTVRRGHNGVVQEKAEDVAAALVTQLASRNHDPQLHTHCVLSSAARGSDGRVSAINAATIHKASKVIGSVYQQELRYQLSASLGVGWDVRNDGLGEISAVPAAVLKKFSSRSQDIDASLDAQHEADMQLLRDVELRLDVYERAAYRVKAEPDEVSELDIERAEKFERYHRLLRASYSENKFDKSRRRLVKQLTRKGKDEPAEAELRDKWVREWEETGVSWDAVLRKSQFVRSEQVVDAIQSGDAVVAFRERLEDALVVQNATFGRKEAIVAGLRVADPAWDSSETLRQVESFLSEYALVVREDTSKYANWALGAGAKYTTANVLEQERALRESAGRMLDRDDVAVCNLGVTAQKALEYTLNDEQEDLMTALCVSGQQLVMARGIAGSGKTWVLGAAASVLRTEGYQVVGLATAAATAQRLSSESGFDRSSSIDKFLQLAERGLWERGTSAPLLRNRESLLEEQRELRAKWDGLKNEIDPEDTVALDALAEERAAEFAEWQTRWDKWLESAGREIELREEVGAALEQRQATLDDLERELLFREAQLADLEADEAAREAVAIREDKGRLREARQRLREDRAEYMETMSPNEKLPDDDKVVIVVDEAGMVETSHYYNLLKLAEERNWKVAFVGDDRQLQEVNRGGAFRLLTDMGGSVELGTARRAEAEWEKRAQSNWWSSEDPNQLQDVANEYIKHDRVTFITERVVRTAIAAEKIDPDLLDPKQVEREVARQIMVSKFFDDYDKGIEHLLVAGTREDVHALNKAVQAEMIARGEIDPSGVTAEAVDVRDGKITGVYTLHAGDKIMITKNMSGTPVKNGMVGSVDRVGKDGSIFALLPTGPEGINRKHLITAEQLEAGYVALGNAVTAHKSQGMSVANCTALADKSSTREMLYPAMTRGKQGNFVVWLDDGSGRAPEEQLAGAMSRSGRKLTALEAWGKEPSDHEISVLMESLRSEGSEITYEEAYERIVEQRRVEFLAHKEEAARRDAKMELSSSRLADHKRERSADKGQVLERTLEQSKTA